MRLRDQGLDQKEMQLRGQTLVNRLPMDREALKHESRTLRLANHSA